MILMSLLHKASRAMTGVRYDCSPLLPYHKARTFGVKEERFSFKSGKWTLHGSKYSTTSSPKAIVIFFHGLGDGRASYVKEISLIAKEGYWVYAYDNQGSNESEGREIHSMGITVQNQRDFFHYLDSLEDAKGYERYAIGHSWGGYGALISAQNEYKISKIVSLAGYVSFVLLCQKTTKNGLLKKLWRPSMRLFEGKDSLLDARDVLRNSDAKVLYIGGEKDPMVPKDISYDLLRKEFAGDKRFSFKSIKGSGHSPWRTLKAQEYVHGLLHKGIADPYRNFMETMDLDRATEENPEVMKTIFDFFAS